MNKDVVTVITPTVACEGNGPITGHPKVFLTFKPGTRDIVCPYCSRTFHLDEHAATTGAH